MSHENYNIVIGGEGVRRSSNGVNAEKIIFFSNFVRVSKGLLSTIVALWKKLSRSNIQLLLLLQVHGRGYRGTDYTKSLVGSHSIQEDGPDS